MRRPAALLVGLTLIVAIAVVMFAIGTEPPSTTTPATAAAPAPTARATLPPPGTGDESAAERSLSGAASDAPEPLAAESRDPSLAVHVTGRIVDPRQRPVAGARAGLGLAPSDNSSLLDVLHESAGPRLWAVSGSDGRFSLDQPAYGQEVLLLAAADGPPEPRAPLCVMPGVSIDLGDLVLRDAFTITGRVEDENGQPVPDAEVLVTDAMNCARALVDQPVSAMQLACWGENVGDEEWVQSFLRGLRWSTRTLSGSDGRFSVRAWSSAGELFAAARKEGWTPAAHAPDFHYGDVSEETLTELPVLVLCRAPAHIAGRVVAADGSPPGTEVVVTATSVSPDPPHPDLGRVVRAAPDGSFEIDGLVGGRQELSALAADARASPDITANAGATDVRLVLGERQRVLVHVTRDGAPARAAQLLIGRRSPLALGLDAALTWEGRAVPADGTILIDPLPLDEVTLQACAENACSWPEPVPTWSKQRRVELTLELLPATAVRGVVVDRDSEQPIAGATLRAQVRQAAAHFANDRVVTGDDGRFTIGPLPLDASVARGQPIEISIRAPGHLNEALRAPLDTTAPQLVALGRRTLVQLRPDSATRDMGFRIVRVNGLDRPGEWVAQSLPPTGLFIDSLAPGRYHATVDGLDDVAADFTAVAGRLVVVDL